MPQVTLAQRFYLGAVAALAVWVGIWCYFVPSMSESAIPWHVPPLCATFLGAMYLSGAVFNATCLCARRWADIRVIMPMIALWLSWTHRGQRSVHSVDEAALPSWIRYYLLAQGSLMVGLALALLCLPQTMLALWPWSTGRLMLQLYAAPLLSY